MAEMPANIQEFNIISGLIFVQLYTDFPVRLDIDRAVIAAAMDIPGRNWSTHKLPSGRIFSAVLNNTVDWLSAEGFVKSAGSHPAEGVTLSAKGLAALNAAPDGLNETIGTALTDVAEQGWRRGLNSIGDLMGSIIGGASNDPAPKLVAAK
jgi:hypothetical protein